MSKASLLELAKKLNIPRRNCMKTKEELEEAIKDIIKLYKEIIFGSDTPVCMACLDELQKQQIIDQHVYDHVYLVLTSQVQARSSMAGNSASAVDAQEVFKSAFKVLIDKDYSISNDIKRYQDVLEHALSKVDFYVGIRIYMFPSNFNLNIGSTKGYNNKILISSASIKIGSNIE